MINKGWFAKTRVVVWSRCWYLRSCLSYPLFSYLATSGYDGGGKGLAKAPESKIVFRRRP